MTPMYLVKRLSPFADRSFTLRQRQIPLYIQVSSCLGEVLSGAEPAAWTAYEWMATRLDLDTAAALALAHDAAVVSWEREVAARRMEGE